MWRVQVDNLEFLTTFDNLFKFMDFHRGKLISIKFIEEWIPIEKKEPLTHKEREGQPKEPIPLSRFNTE